MTRAHWDRKYLETDEQELSWHQPEPSLSLELIESLRPEGGRLIDIGGGTSRLVDRLLVMGRWQVTMLDISPAALNVAQHRLGTQPDRVNWVVADVTAAAELPEVDVWHDRAVFHFLTHPADRYRYVSLAERSLPPGAHLVIATFAPTGPTRCSGLPVSRYDAASLIAAFRGGFELQGSRPESHRTPAGAQQDFVYAVLRRTKSPVGLSR